MLFYQPSATNGELVLICCSEIIQSGSDASSSNILDNFQLDSTTGYDANKSESKSEFESESIKTVSICVLRLCYSVNELPMSEPCRQLYVEIASDAVKNLKQNRPNVKANSESVQCRVFQT